MPGAFCNVKGRVISDLVVVQVNDRHCLLRLRASLADIFATTLKRYAQFSRISIDRETSADAVTGVYADAPELDAFAASNQGAGIAKDLWAQNHIEDRIILRSSATQAEIITLSPPSMPTPLTADCGEGQESHWRAETLYGGHYALESVDLERFTPQVLNYDQRGRVAFDKGCYTGQEVIARLHYKGKSKRRVQIYALENESHAGDTETPPALDREMPVFAEDGEAQGKLLAWECNAQGRILLAAEIQADYLGLPARLREGPGLIPITPSPSGSLPQAS